MANYTYIRGTLLHFLADPDQTPADKSYQLIEDGLLIIHDGKIVAADHWDKLKNQIPDTAEIKHYPHGLIVPGFIDTHIHFPQTDMIAANSGGNLLTWLETHTFPHERRFEDKQYATEVANFFVDELFRNGTTSALVFTTVHPQSVNAIFEVAEAKKMRLIAGKSLGDQNAPDYFLEPAETAYKESVALIKKWHKKYNTRLLYALSPRYAPAVSSALFEIIEKLKHEFPDVYVHTHISENEEEVRWTKELFNTPDYLSVYDNYHLLGRKTVLAHGIHLSDAEFKRIAETQTNIAFCPTSNMFLGSGLFNLARAKQNQINMGIGTDVGAGTSFSMMQTLNEAYKILQLQRQNLSALQGFYLATLGGAKALDLENKLGNFIPTKEADFVVLDFSGATPLLQRRFAHADTFIDKLFALMMLGDDRSVVATYVNGNKVYARN